MNMQRDTQPETVLINHTRSACLRCGTLHPARVERVGNEIFFVADCPQGATATRISSDAETFLQIRRKSPVDVTQPPPDADYRWLYLINVTNDCNRRCPVCLDPRGENEPIRHLSRQEAEDLASLVRHGGRKAVVLTGGEPTMHPDLPGIVRTLAGRGFRVAVATNGRRLAEEGDYAKRLRRAGASMVWLQLDTLDEDVHEEMRGTRNVAQKTLAAERVIAAGMRLALTMTATSRTLSTIDRLLAYALTLVPGLSVLSIHVAAPAGRFELPRGVLVDREQVIDAVASSPTLRGRVSKGNFWPQPVFSPWRAAVHPDCSANLVLLVDGESVRPLDEVVDLDALYRRLAAARMGSSWYSRNVVPLWYALGAAAPRRRRPAAQAPRLLGHLWGLLMRRGRRGVLVVTVSDLMRRDCQDQQRLDRCTSCELSATGKRPACRSCWGNED